MAKVSWQYFLCEEINIDDLKLFPVIDPLDDLRLILRSDDSYFQDCQQFLDKLNNRHGRTLIIIEVKYISFKNKKDFCIVYLKNV